MLTGSFALLVAAWATTTDPDVPQVRSFIGPATLCGRAFALRLDADERALMRDPAIDFITYRVEGNDGPFLLYEGNAPQPSDDRIATGLNWPSVIAIHDQRHAAARQERSIRDRLLLGRDRAAECPAAPEPVR